jgi:hypothetical protein
LKQSASLLIILSVIFSCRPTKKVQTIHQAISKRDTVQTIVIHEIPKVDTLALVNAMLDKVNKNRIDFSTFNAKVKVEYMGAETNQSAVAYIKMKKDSIILIQLVGPLGIVGMQVKITHDSVTLINKIDHYVQFRSISYLTDITQIPFDFTTLQDLILGNPIFISNNVVSYKQSENNLVVMMIGDFFKNLITLNNSDYKPIHSKLDDIHLQKNRTCDITFGSYEEKGNIQFSTYRNISVSEKSKLDVYLDFKQYAFNEPINFTLNIPKNYKRK